jgi:hypothetical protein
MFGDGDDFFSSRMSIGEIRDLPNGETTLSSFLVDVLCN